MVTRITTITADRKGEYPLYIIGMNINIMQINVKTKPIADLNPFLLPIMQSISNFLNNCFLKTGILTVYKLSLINLIKQI